MNRTINSSLSDPPISSQSTNGGTEYILETDKKQHVVKDEESACLIGFTKPLVKINGEYQGAERTVPINTDKILSLELHHNDYTIEPPNDNVLITPKTILELNESVNITVLIKTAHTSGLTCRQLNPLPKNQANPIKTRITEGDKVWEL